MEIIKFEDKLFKDLNEKKSLNKDENNNCEKQKDKFNSKNNEPIQNSSINSNIQNKNLSKDDPGSKKLTTFKNENLNTNQIKNPNPITSNSNKSSQKPKLNDINNNSKSTKSQNSKLNNNSDHEDFDNVKKQKIN